MKKILLINWRDIKNPEAGGAEMYYHEIFRRLEGRGYQTTILSHMFPGALKEEVIDGMRTVRIGSKLLFNFSVIGYVNRHQNEYDYIIEDINKVPFLTPLYTKKRRLHMVMHFFKGSIFSETVFPLALYIYCMEHCVPFFYRKDPFVAISESTADEIVDFGIDRKNISIVEPGIDTTFFKKTVSKSDPPVVSYVGRLMKYKNVQFIIQALPKLREMVPGVVFEIGGSGDYKGELELLAKKLSVAESVKFLGRISEEEKRDMLSRSTLFVNPSLKEGWGINNIEANLCRTISLSNNVPGLKDSVIDNVTGLLYENGNIEDFCNKAYSVLSDKNLLHKLEEQAYKRALSLDWDSIAERMEKILNEYV